MTLASRAYRAVVVACLVATSAACGSHPSTDASMTLGQAQSRWEKEAAHYGPNPQMTPGHLCTRDNPDFDELRYPAQIVHCRRDVSSGLKKHLKQEYRIPDAQRGEYEIDHLIPLSVGGSNDPKNLWPLWSPIARQKSEYELELMNSVSAGTMTQAQAIAAIKAWRPTGQQP